MPATETMVNMIADLRRMIAEPSATTYSDVTLERLIGLCAVNDSRGVAPTVMSYATVPPTETANPDWIESYDLNACAAAIWDEKAAGVACDPNFSADGLSVQRSQVYDQYTKQAQRYRSRSCGGVLDLTRINQEINEAGELVDVVRITPTIERSGSPWAINAAETDA